MSFRDDFAHTPPGPQREALVYRAILQQGKPTDLIPVTVNGPQNTRITYYVTSDFLNVDGVWLPMTGVTAQSVADHFGMILPTPKMSRQIYAAATTKIMPTPLSESGYGNYTAQQVVQSRISTSDAALAYSQRIANEQGKGQGGLTAGHMKDITQPPPSGNLGLYGWYGTNGKPVQNSYFTPHDTNQHTEYGSGLRLVDNRVEVSYPNGHSETITMNQLMNSNLVSAVSDTPGIARYDINQDRANLASITPSTSEIDTTQYTPERPISGRLQFLQRLNDLISNTKS